MAAGKNRKSGKRSKPNAATDPGRDQLLRDAGGFDWGWPALGMVVGNNELTRHLFAGGFVACGYGAIPDGPPFITLLGDNAAGMKSAFALMREWTKDYGPNAIRLEILFDGPGYVLAISQQPDLMRWRLAGLDTALRPLMVGMTHMKRLDSRHPYLERLADYSRQPVAPVVLTIAQLPNSARGRVGNVTVQFEPDWEEAIWLPGLDIYKDVSQRPVDSMARLDAEMKEGPTPGWPPAPEREPADLAQERERLLSATLPKTLHVLRHHWSAARLFASEEIRACARWQIEQAVCNLRLHDFIRYKPNSRAKHLSLLEDARRNIVEPASQVIDLAGFGAPAVAEQISLDAAYLLRRLDEKSEPPRGLASRLDRLRELGYV